VGSRRHNDRGVDMDRAIRKAMKGSEDGPHFVMLPHAILNDLRLSGDAVRAFCVLLDCAFGGRSKISFRRLGERLGVSRQTARRIIEEIVSAGHAKNRETVNGRCPSYELTVSTTGTNHDMGLAEAVPPTGIKGDTGTGTNHDTGRARTGIKSDADPYQNGHPTRITGDTLSRLSNLNYILEGTHNEKKDDDEDPDKPVRRLFADVLAEAVKPKCVA
jgi:hypothetical protein